MNKQTYSTMMAIFIGAYAFIIIQFVVACIKTTRLQYKVNALNNAHTPDLKLVDTMLESTQEIFIWLFAILIASLVFNIINRFFKPV